MSIEAMKLALDALEKATPVKAKDPQMQADAIVALRQAIKEAEQAQPVACIGTNGELIWIKKPAAIYSKPQPLYTAPR